MRPDDKSALLNICKTIGVRAWWGTECLIAAHLKRTEFGNIQMVADNAYGVPFIRPFCIKHDKLCIKIDGLCIRRSDYSTDGG